VEKRRTCKPVAAGILAIISGCLGILCTFSLVIPIVILGTLEIDFAEHILVTIAVLFAIVGTLAIIGGAFSLQRKLWGVALAGSIAALIAMPILGFVAVILTALSRDEFT